MGDIDFPPPNRPLNFAYTNIVLPPPPPVRLQPPPSQQAPTTSPDKAPLEAPDVIKPEVSVRTKLRTSGRQSTATTTACRLAFPARWALPSPPCRRLRRSRRKPVRPGGNIQPPRRIVSVAPVYPAIAQQARVEGTVEIEALIGEDGKVRNAKVISGKAMLTDAALTAVRQWVFTPTRLNGEPVAVIMTVTVVFILQ